MLSIPSVILSDKTGEHAIMLGFSQHKHLPFSLVCLSTDKCFEWGITGILSPKIKNTMHLMLSKDG